MNRRYMNRVDIAMKVTEKDKLLQLGLKKRKVTIPRSSDQKSKIPALRFRCSLMVKFGRA